MILRRPFDSVVVLPRRTGNTASDVWSEVTAERVGELLARDRDLRVIPADRANACFDDDEQTPEAIGRELNVDAVALCGVTPHERGLDADVELIDVLAESVIGTQKFLSSVVDAGDLSLYAARSIGHWLQRDERRIDVPTKRCDFARIVAIRTAQRENRFRDALQCCRDAPLAKAGIALRVAVARAIVDAPVGASAGDIAIAKRAIRGVNTAEADALAARIACRFDRRWKRARQRFEVACARPNSGVVQGAYAVFLIAMRDFDAARLRVPWIGDPRKREDIEALLNALFTNDAEAAAQAIRNASGVTDDDYVRAQRLALQGQRANASAALADGVAAYSPLVMFMNVDPAFRDLRGSRRFAALLRDLRFA